eukprot:m.34052 g.34052  ORF g.34052 m.34052 type:complete len:59 (-) comp8659_c0_seq1:299-475(-)
MVKFSVFSSGNFHARLRVVPLLPKDLWRTPHTKFICIEVVRLAMFKKNDFDKDEAKAH